MITQLLSLFLGLLFLVTPSTVNPNTPVISQDFLTLGIAATEKGNYPQAKEYFNQASVSQCHHTISL